MFFPCFGSSAKLLLLEVIQKAHDTLPRYHMISTWGQHRRGKCPKSFLANVITVDQKEHVAPQSYALVANSVLFFSASWVYYVTMSNKGPMSQADTAAVYLGQGVFSQLDHQNKKTKGFPKGHFCDFNTFKCVFLYLQYQSVS